MICIFVGVFTTYIMANLAGNKSGKRADAAAKVAVLRLEPAEGKALLIVARKGFIAKAAGMNLTLDSKPVAQIKAPQFTALEIDPGMHRLGLELAGFAGKQSASEIHTFEAVASGRIILVVTMAMGLVQGSMRIAPMPAGPEAVALLRPMTMILPES